MDVFDINHIVEGHAAKGELYYEFFEAERLSVGLYVLKSGTTDPQTPDTEDEIYYVVSGKWTVEIEGEQRKIGPGAVIYVGEHVNHRFHTITEDLNVIVVFAPPRHSLRT